MKTFPRRSLLAAVCLPVAVAVMLSLCTAGSASGQAGDTDQAMGAVPAGGRVEEAVRLQRNIKRRFSELIRIMHDVARQIATADPDTASAIESAATKAEDALIADDMDRVVSLLQGGLVVPADATQAKIIQRLQEVLKALQGGNELEWLLFMMEQMKEDLEALKAIVLAQRELERVSRILAYPDAAKTALGAAKTALAPLAARQDELLRRVRELPADPVAARLGSARQMVADLDARFAKARKAFASPYPSADEVSLMGSQAQEIMRQAIRRRTELRTLFNDPDVGGAMQKLGLGGEREQADTAVGRSIDELGKAAKACSGNNIDEAKLAVAEAERGIQDLSEALKKIMSAMPSTKPLVGILSEQTSVSADIEKMAPQIERLVPVENNAEPAGWKQGVQAAPRDGAKAPDANAVTPFDPSGIALAQEYHSELLVGWNERLDVAGKEIEDRVRDPRYPQQTEQQKRIVESMRKLVTRNRERAKDGAAGPAASAGGGEATNAPSDFRAFVFPNALVMEVARAMDFAATAAGHLEVSAPVPANSNQVETLRLLEHVLAEASINNAMNIYEMEKKLVEQWIAYFYRMIMQQKACSAETEAVWGKRLPDNTFRRPEQLRLTTLSKAEARILKDMELVEKVLSNPELNSSGAPPKVFFLLKDMIKEGVAAVSERLAAFDAGPETQEMQKQILAWLEGALQGMMLKGMENTDPDKPMEGAPHVISNRDVTKKGRLVTVSLMVTMQQQINARVKLLSAQLKAKPDSVELRSQLRRTVELQGMVLGTATEFVDADRGSGVIGKAMGFGD
jgi:hypothetical protein